MLELIKRVAEKFLEKSQNKEIQLISHFDTDGITSAAILTRTFQRLGLNFRLRIVKNLEKEVFENLPKNHLIFFSDLGSNSFQYIKDIKEDVFILDHHEIISEIPSNVTIANTHLCKNYEDLSSAAICYLFAKKIDEQNKDLAYLSIIGMVGDMLEKNLGKTYTNIIKESNIKVKKGLLLYPATRPIDRVLEYSSNILIPGVTGSSKGANEFLRELGLERENGKYKTILEINEEELSRLITAITLQRSDSGKTEDLVGNIYLVNFLNKLKDTIIGTIASIISNSREYPEGKAIIGMAYNQDKIKVSARMVGKSGKNIREVLNAVIEIIGGEVGGHPMAAGCLIEKQKEGEFIIELKKKLEIEMIKI